MPFDDWKLRSLRESGPQPAAVLLVHPGAERSAALQVAFFRVHTLT